MANWRNKAIYLSDSDDTIYQYQAYCGGCGYAIDGPYAHTQHIDSDEDKEMWAIRFCPWCGVPLNAESWRGVETEGLRPVEHTVGPAGSHRGDIHEFEPAAYIQGGHGLMSNDPEYMCACRPEVTRGNPCTIRHKKFRANNRYYKSVLAARVKGLDSPVKPG